MRIHTCPQCELRFVDEPELADHLEHDHGMDRTRLEHRYGLRSGGRPRRRPPDPTRVVQVDPHRERR